MIDVKQWQCRDRILRMDGAPLTMGILNVTPDSFSDGGRYADVDQAIAWAHTMVAEGAAIVDVGGESTRPGADPVTADEEAARVVPVIEGLVGCGAAVSIDTTKSEVARAALAAGACIVNDVSACTADAAMADVVAATGAGVVLMHMRGTPRTMQEAPLYEDVVAEVREYLMERVAAVRAAGVAREAIAIDPGIGFGKTVAHNLALLANLDRLGDWPLVVGLSRKRFLGALTGREVGDRLAGSLAGLVCAVWQGAQVLRVHDVRASVDAVAVAAAVAGCRRKIACPRVEG